MICPDCSGICNSKEIKLIYAIYDDKEIFMCPRCRRFYKLEQIDEEYMEELVRGDFQNMRNKLSNDTNQKEEVKE